MNNSQDTNINSIEKQENLKRLEQLSEDYSNNIRRSEESSKNDLQKNEESEKHEFLSKTNEIMQQINEYINEEKNNLK